MQTDSGGQDEEMPDVAPQSTVETPNQESNGELAETLDRMLGVRSIVHDAHSAPKSENLMSMIYSWIPDSRIAMQLYCIYCNLRTEIKRERVDQSTTSPSYRLFAFQNGQNNSEFKNQQSS